MAQQGGTGGNLCFKCGINRTNSLYCVYCSVDDDANDNDDDDKKQERDERREFLAESSRKKNYYNQFTSFSSYANSNNVNVADEVLVDDPHFVLTLNNLDGLIEGGGNYNEVDKVKELKECIKNNSYSPEIDNIRSKLANVYSVDKSRVIVNDIFYGTTNIGYIIIDYLKKGVQKLIKNAKEFIKKMNYSFDQFKKLVITPPPESTDGSYALVKSYHVSCASRKPGNDWNCSLEEQNLGGVVLYMKDGKKDWYCNGRHCKIGYIIVKPIEDLKNITSNHGAIHGRVYKSVFNEEPTNVVGSGFARQAGQWKWNSGSFNARSDEWHDTKGKYSKQCESKTMNDVEAKWIEKSVKNWFDTGNQNTMVDEALVIFKD